MRRIDRRFFAPASIATRFDSPRLPNYDREYRYQQYFGFVQDTVRLTPRLTANFGLRYESFGAPQNVGDVKDTLVQLGSGATLADRLTTASLVTPASGNQQLYGADRGDIAVRAGASYDISGTGRTLLRAAYGIFYDRPFDNLWQNIRSNDVAVPQITLTAATTNFTGPVSTALANLPGRLFRVNFPALTLMDPDLRNGPRPQLFCRRTASLHGSPDAGDERARVVWQPVDHHRRRQPRFLDGARPLQPGAARYFVSLRSRRLELQRVHCGPPLSSGTRHVPGRLHVVPHHRQSERAACRRLLQPQLHQHRDQPTFLRPARAFRASSIRTPIAATPTLISATT
ncbi:MAG: hypothetical protein WDO18_19090 [Acidobacteriota bacterium]